MVGRRSVGAGRAALALVTLVSLPLWAAACAGAGTSVPPTDAPVSAIPASEVPGSAAPDGSGADVDGPPVASIAVEGGDPVAGQLGTYTWRATGSDSPWLRGAPMSVGVGEVLSLALEPPVAIEAWTVRYVPSAADGPAGAVTLGSGTGGATFDVPPAGDCTVVLAVVFADGQGEASYAWAVHVE